MFEHLIYGVVQFDTNVNTEQHGLVSFAPEYKYQVDVWLLFFFVRLKQNKHNLI